MWSNPSTPPILAFAPRLMSTIIHQPSSLPPSILILIWPLLSSPCSISLPEHNVLVVGTTAISLSLSSMVLLSRPAFGQGQYRYFLIATKPATRSKPALIQPNMGSSKKFSCPTINLRNLSPSFNICQILHPLIPYELHLRPVQIIKKH